MRWGNRSLIPASLPEGKGNACGEPPIQNYSVKSELTESPWLIRVIVSAKSGAHDN